MGRGWGRDLDAEGQMDKRETAKSMISLVNVAVEQLEPGLPFSSSS